jgi:hypothetical protein
MIIEIQNMIIINKLRTPLLSRHALLVHRCLRVVSSKYICAPFKVLPNPDRIVIMQGRQLDEPVPFEEFYFPVLKVRLTPNWWC